MISQTKAGIRRYVAGLGNVRASAKKKAAAASRREQEVPSSGIPEFGREVFQLNTASNCKCCMESARQAKAKRDGGACGAFARIFCNSPSFVTASVNWAG